MLILLIDTAIVAACSGLISKLSLDLTAYNLSLAHVSLAMLILALLVSIVLLIVSRIRMSFTLFAFWISGTFFKLLVLSICLYFGVEIYNSCKSYEKTALYLDSSKYFDARNASKTATEFLFMLTIMGVSQILNLIYAVFKLSKVLLSSFSQSFVLFVTKSF